MSIYIQNIADAMRAVSRAKSTFFSIVQKNTAAAWLSREVYDKPTAKKFNASVREATTDEFYDRSVLSKCWACFAFYGEVLAIAWANGVESAPTLEVAYRAIPRERAESTVITKLGNLMNGASLEELEAMSESIAQKLASVREAQATAEIQNRRKNEVREKILAGLSK